MRTLLRVLAVVALIGAGLTGYWAWLGYFGGATYVRVAATAPPSPAFAGLSAVIVSGDMGFRVGMAPQIAARLAADGIPVTGINSLVHFRQRRTPAEVEALLADAVRRNPGRVVLIGQSYGADMVHVGLAGLPPELRARIALVALVVPTDTVDYQASPAELLDLVADDGPALPTARQLTWAPVLCVWGREERDSLCPLLTASNVRTVALPGGHPLHRDVDALYASLRAAITASVAP